MYNIYGMRPGDVWWAASDLGWVVGHSYIAYAPLLHGNTTVLFEVSEVRQLMTDLGWVVGHSYIAYAPLLHGNTTIVFEVSEVRQVMPDNGLCGGSLLHRLCPAPSRQHHSCV